MKSAFEALTLINQINGIITSENLPYHSMADGWRKIKGVLTADSSKQFDVIQGLKQMEQATSRQSDDTSLRFTEEIQNIQKRSGLSVCDKSSVVFIDGLPLNGGGAVRLCQAILNMLSSDNRASLSDEGKAVGKHEDRSNYKQEELRNAINDYSSSSPLAPLSIPTIEMSINPSEEDKAKILRILDNKLRSSGNRDSQEAYSSIKLNEQELEEFMPIVKNAFQKAWEVQEQELECKEQELEEMEEDTSENLNEVYTGLESRIPYTQAQMEKNTYEHLKEIHGLGAPNIFFAMTPSLAKGLNAAKFLSGRQEQLLSGEEGVASLNHEGEGA